MKYEPPKGKALHQQAVKHLVTALRNVFTAMTDEERLWTISYLMDDYCPACGCYDPSRWGCQCANDE